MTRPFDKVLVANRGEIAARIFRACRAYGLRSVAVYSDADADACHARLADEAVRIGPPAARDSYLRSDAILEAAALTGADAVHPGYGFLSEQATFAAAVRDAGLIFVGPSPEAIEAMGDKANAKRIMRGAGVPCVPGYDDDDQSIEALKHAAAQLRYPIMIKARAGGGGRGMRRVRDPAELEDALRSARSEASSAFGSGDLLLEQVVVSARHVELQIVGDVFGNVVHLGERDCSLQRRHQKVIEEAPCPAIGPELRAAMGEAACRAARAIGYTGVGTVEFLVDADRRFYFLEMNTRLQVEHPVTEMVTGIDLVELQFDIARGRPLPFRQEDIAITGHAIEARLCAEDPDRDFLPQSGRIKLWRPARDPWVRVDDGIETGSEVTSFYDPMLAKIIVSGSDRDQARRRLIRALEDTVLFGVKTNASFLAELLKTPTFAAGDATTDFIGQHRAAIAATDDPPKSPTGCLIAAALLYATAETQTRTNARFAFGERRWTPMTLRIADDVYDVRVRRDGAAYDVCLTGRTTRIEIHSQSVDRVQFTLDGVRRSAVYLLDDRCVHLNLDGRTIIIDDDSDRMSSSGPGATQSSLRAPMSGNVTHVAASAGQRVARGDLILVLEAMKMEHKISAPHDGLIVALPVAEGDAVTALDLLAEINPVEPN